MKDPRKWKIWQMFFVSRRDFLQLRHEVFYIMTTQTEMAAAVTAVNEKLVKIGTETTALKARVDELSALVTAGEASPELVAAVQALVAQAQIVDDLVQDA